MIQSPGLLLTIVAFLGVIGPLVFIHEMGHYLAARWFGVKAEVFSIGFGREIFGWSDRRGTRWKIGWLPLGGYVRFAGDMNPASQPSAEWLSLPADERNRTFPSKPVWQRAVIVAAGPLVNLLAAVLILAGFSLAFGDAQGPAAVGSVQPGSAAAKAGLQTGDEIVALGGKRIDRFADLVAAVQPRPGQAIRIDYRRDGAPASLTARIGSASATGPDGKQAAIGLLGIAPRPATLLEAPAIGVRRTGAIIGLMVGALGDVVTGQRSVKELGGPLTIARASGQQAAQGWAAWTFLVALVSVNLGFINLLPVPMLDGGHLMFYAIEAVRRRPVGPAATEWAYRGGLAALAALMLLVTFNDLGSAGVWSGLGRGLAGLID